MLFSWSTAIGLDFYWTKNFECFKDSEETVNFTLIVNDVVDGTESTQLREFRNMVIN